jgi:hypothetical protein
VPEWIAAVASSVAALGTVGALLIALNLFRHERQDRETRFAETITAWTLEQATEPSYIVCVGNAGKAAVFRCSVWVGPPKDKPLGTMKLVDFGIVPPGEKRDMQNPISKDAIDFDQLDDPLSDPWIEVAFVDSAGRTWKRSSDGRLVQGQRLPGY